MLASLLRIILLTATLKILERGLDKGPIINIYHRDVNSGQYIQENSHHSLDNGVVNPLNYNRDLESQYVLISDYYWYFGKSAVLLPNGFRPLIKRGPGFKKFDEKSNCIILDFISWLEKNFQEKNLIDVPSLFAEPFERYDGK